MDDVKKDLDDMAQSMYNYGDKVNKWSIYYVPQGKFIITAGIENINVVGVGDGFKSALANLSEEYFDNDIEEEVQGDS